MTQLGTNLSLSLSLSAAAADWQGVLATTVVAKHIPSAPGARNSTIILDTGKNHAGVCRFKLQGSAENKGQKVVMRCALTQQLDHISTLKRTLISGRHRRAVFQLTCACVRVAVYPTTTLWAYIGKTTPFLRHFMLKLYRFTKTGSGQTYHGREGTHKKSCCGFYST
jgi:hypothetical protein